MYLINKQPETVMVAKGNTAGFSVEVDEDCTVQWYKNGIAIPTATNTEYYVTATALNNLSYFEVEVTDADGYVEMSRQAQLLVGVDYLIPKISTQPVPETEVTLGEEITLTVAATDYATAQWFKNGNAIEGATELTLTDTPDEYLSSYRIRLYGENGEVTASDIAYVSAYEDVVLPTMTTSPANEVEAAIGETVTLAVTGSNYDEINWTIHGRTPENKVVSEDQLSLSFDVTDQRQDFSTIYAEMRNEFGTVRSNGTILHVLEEGETPTLTGFTVAISDDLIGVGDTATVSVDTVTPEGADASAVVWSSLDETIATVDTSGAVTGVADGDTEIVGTVDELTSSVAISVGEYVTITTQPTDVTVTEGEAASFTVTANNATGYQWQVQTETEGTYTNIEGATEATYTVDATTLAMDGSVIRCQCQGELGNKNSNAVTLTVEAIVEVEITSQPSDITVTEGDDATFEITATDATGYQWQVQTDVEGGFTDIDGATEATFTATEVPLTANGYVLRCKAYNEDNIKFSNGATLTVEEAIVEVAITTQPRSDTVTEGDHITFALSATGATGYQWQVQNETDGEFVDIEGETSTSYRIEEVAYSQNGNGYRCNVYNEDDSELSDTATLTVIELKVDIDTQPADITVTEGETATFTVEATGYDSICWYYKTEEGDFLTEVEGATEATLTITDTTLDMNGYIYSATLTNTNETVGTDEAILTVEAAATEE